LGVPVGIVVLGRPAPPRLMGGFVFGTAGPGVRRSLSSGVQSIRRSCRRVRLCGAQLMYYGADGDLIIIIIILLYYRY
jgi:hypothetical protein